MCISDPAEGGMMGTFRRQMMPVEDDTKVCGRMTLTSDENMWLSRMRPEMIPGVICLWTFLSGYLMISDSSLFNA